MTDLSTAPAAPVLPDGLPFPAIPAEATGALRNRMEIERAICGRLVLALLAAGYALRADQEGEWGGPRSEDAREIAGQLFACDMEDIFVYRPSGDSPTGWFRCGWVQLVYGNDGHDVISDYTTNLEAVLAPVNAYADRCAELGRVATAADLEVPA